MTSKDQSSFTGFVVTGFIYGAKQTRIEFDLIVPYKPDSLATTPLPVRTAYAKEECTKTLTDLKSAYPLNCEFCGDKPARENFITGSDWLHHPPKGQPAWMGKPSAGPLVVLYIHAICNLNGVCGEAARGMGAYLASFPTTGPKDPLPDFSSMSNDGLVVYPRNGSCAFCNSDRTVSTELSKCSGCRAARYCGDACQKNDWVRHKKTCKYIAGIRFVEPMEDKLTIWKENTDERWPGDLLPKPIPGV